MSKTDFPLIKKEIGGVTYEHVLIENLPKNVITVAAERNLYVDEYHEVNLCAYWNVRKIGTYEFSPEYNFYITDGRLCLNLYWNLGHITDESKIIKKFSSLDEAKDSEYYQDFCIMKEKIEKAVQERIEYLKNYDEYKYGTMTGGTQFDLEGCEYEWCCTERKEYVQLKVDLKKDQWILTTSKHKIGDLKKLMSDFEEIDKRELHLLTYHDDLDVKNLDKSSPYYTIVKFAKEGLGLIGGVLPGKKDYSDFKYLEYWSWTYNFPPSKIVSKSKKRLLIDGTMQSSKMDAKGKILSKEKENIDSKKAEACYKNLAEFLSLGRLKNTRRFGGPSGILKIKYKDGHLEKYNLGLSYKTKHLLDIITFLI